MLFASFLILTAVDLSGFFIYNYIADYPDLEVFLITTSKLQMPLFYLYVVSVCYVDFRLKPQQLLHAIPFVLFNLVLIPHFYLLSVTAKNYYLENFSQMPAILFFEVLGEMQYVFYMIASFWVLRRYKKIYLENYTHTDNSLYKWLFQILILSLIAHSIVVTKNLLKHTDSAGVFISANVIVGTIALSILCWFVLKALNYPELFRGIDSTLPLAKEIVLKPEVENGVSEPENELIKTQIEFLKNYMVEQEPYLEPSLTIQELANQINIPVRELSVLINHHMDQHFFDFVNEYRIQKAIKILKDPTKRDLTILEILYKVGFNSKSSFHTSFKKHTNLTPTDCRNSSL